jgi:hypothetical protein
MSRWSTAGGDYEMTSMEADPDEPVHDEPVKLAQAIGEWAARHHRAEPEAEPEPEEYDPDSEVDDEGGISEYRHYADWAAAGRAESERETRI